MEDAVPEHQEASMDPGYTSAELKGRAEGVEATSAVKTKDDSAMDKTPTGSTSKPCEPQEQRSQMESITSLPPMASMSPKVKLRTLTNHEHHPAPSDQTFPASTLPGMLPPLSIRGETDTDTSQHSPSSGPSRRRANTDKDPPKNSDRPRGISLRTAALTVLSAETMRDYRRSSAAMHIELLRVFVPDILIKVSAASGA